MVLPAPALLAVALLLGFLVLIPARRLQLAGLSSRFIGTYAAGLWALGFLLAFRPVMLRFLVPILLIAYIAPFVVAPGRIARVVQFGRGRGRPARRGGTGGTGGAGGRGGPGSGDLPRPPIKNVTPPGPDGPPDPP
jgi:hypothetical protein